VKRASQRRQNSTRRDWRSALWALCVVFVHVAIALPVRSEDAANVSEEPITDEDRDHWSFKPLERPRVPPVANSTWTRTAIDNFILAPLESRGLRPSAEADRTTLVRRLCFDLTGLPPAPKEIDWFLADKLPDAYARLVDRYLSSPRYGERWAQHWLDLARFAETDGFEHDKLRPTAWKYRDWVIRALNSDMPYDRFVRWQIAGDLLAPENTDAVIATAFCLSGPDMPDINSQEERRHTLLNEMTSTVGAVFLGLQFGCAQCHDHKYDPISQADFYRLRAFFQPAVNVKKNKSVTVLSSTAALDAASYLMIRGDWRRRGPRVLPAFPRIADPWNKSRDQRQTLDRSDLARWITRPDHPLTSRILVNRVWQFHFGRGLSGSASDFGIIGDAPSHPELLDWLATEFVSSGWSLKRLHRLIVTSAVYRQSSRPANDIASASADTDFVDEPGLLSRFPRRRLEAEVVRDAMLFVSDLLRDEMGGPGVMPPLPRELVKSLLKNQWRASSRLADHHRRSIYVFARRNLRYPLFEAFDRPAANASCAVRQNTTSAQQSLLMLNSKSSLDAARQLAGSVCDRAGPGLGAQVDCAVQRVWGRSPSDEERQEFVGFLQSQAALLKAENRSTENLALPVSRQDRSDVDAHAGAALTDLCLALLNSNEFLYVD